MLAAAGACSQVTSFTVSRKTAHLSEDMHQYVLAHSAPVTELEQDLIDETQRLLPDWATMQISPEQAVFTRLLTKALGTRFAVEVGTFTGFSALAIARGLAEDGRLLCLDVSEEYTSVARRYWERAGVADRVELRLAPALESLRALPAEPAIDLVFIDADKTEYVDYWEELVPRMRPGGVLLVDNVFQDGRVLDTSDDSPGVTAIRRFNEHVAHDDRVEAVVLPISDGLTFARRR